MLALIVLVQVVATPVEPASRFFSARPVDFWGRRPVEPPAAPPWSEGERPPGPVADLIERPSSENAKRYLAWQKDRLERLHRAMQALEEARREQAPAAAAPAPEILYYTREGCSWCRRQDAVIEEMGLRVRRITPDQAALWKASGVTATPTLVIPGRAPLRGFQTRRQIEEALR